MSTDMVPRVPLERIVHTPHGTPGWLHLPGGRIWIFEEEDQNNKSNISCIPPGIYICKRRFYNKGGYDTWEVTGVPGRSLILFHIGNTEEDLAGCLATGFGLGALMRIDEEKNVRAPKLCVTDSAQAFSVLMRRTRNWRTWELDVRAPAA
jgi:hypothetical protein